MLDFYLHESPVGWPMGNACKGVAKCKHHIFLFVSKFSEVSLLKPVIRRAYHALFSLPLHHFNEMSKRLSSSLLL